MANKTVRKKRPRKPEFLNEAHLMAAIQSTNEVFVGAKNPGPRECRKLAAWLEKAAIFLESKEE